LALFEVPLDLNRATVEEFESLPGIGPALAERIAAARPFRSVADLLKVRGIGWRRVRQLRARLEVVPNEAGKGERPPEGPSSVGIR
jgi:DNA uptake protein ComE-like DNA-binding protein